MKKMHFLMALIVFAMLSFTASAQMQHPHYLVALGDLRDARWLITNRAPADPAQSKEEKDAILQIDAAIREIKDAAIDDGKDINYAPHAGVVKPWKARLYEAMKYLDDADTNILHGEPNPVSRELRDHSHAHIKETKRLIQAVWHS